jgi:hypothetical protein
MKYKNFLHDIARYQTSDVQHSTKISSDDFNGQRSNQHQKGLSRTPQED